MSEKQLVTEESVEGFEVEVVDDEDKDEDRETDNNDNKKDEEQNLDDEGKDKEQDNGENEGAEEINWDEDADDGRTATVIDISISCKDLENKDESDKADPVCVVFQRPNNNPSTLIELMRTEIKENNLCPTFNKKCTFEYKFQESQTLRFHLYDVDEADSVLLEEDSLGFHECSVANIIVAGAMGYTHTLQEGDKILGATITLEAVEKSALKDRIYLDIMGAQVLPCYQLCMAGKSFFQVLRKMENGAFKPCFRSRPIRGINPKWSPMDISFGNLCRADENLPLKIEIYQKNKLGKGSRLIGFASTCLKNILSTTEDPWVISVRLRTTGGKTSQTSISILECSRTPVFTFLDFVQAGMKIHFCFFINFTNSSSPFHVICDDPHIIPQNPYEQIIKSLDPVLRDYNNVYKIFGFGAKVPPDDSINHCFAVTMAESPDCHGVDQVIEQYRKCLGKIKQCDLTNFQPMIAALTSLAKESLDGTNYYVQIILTHALPSDFSRLKETIVRSSEFPMSILVVGIGEVDFSPLKNLTGVLVHDGQVIRRDLFQFLTYSGSNLGGNLTSNETGDGSGVSPDRLAEKMALIDDQVESFMTNAAIQPFDITLRVQELADSLVKKKEE